jgi:hypothetical protein
MPTKNGKQAGHEAFLSDFQRRIAQAMGPRTGNDPFKTSGVMVPRHTRD